MASWRIAQKPNDHLHSVLKAKYFPESSIWRPNLNTPKSGFWASVLKVLPILKTHVSYQLTQGNISIWNTPWYSSWATIYEDLIIQPNGFNYPALVKDLWIPGQKTWNNELIDILFVPSAATIIKQTPIINADDPDFLCWKLTRDGNCNAKSAYHACLQIM